jgi:hypothetical protein
VARVVRCDADELLDMLETKDLPSFWGQGPQPYSGDFQDWHQRAAELEIFRGCGSRSCSAPACSQTGGRGPTAIGYT